jgi:hypothetical protein
MVRARREDCCVWPRCNRSVTQPYHVYTKHFGFCDRHWGKWADIPSDAEKDAIVQEWFGPKVHRVGAQPKPHPQPTPAPSVPPPPRIDASGWAVLAAVLAAKKQEDG